ncbi:TonB-dependent receptor [uncultured Draconibacterium sp.]|uniref:TonB-dependent receptor n=1 Tax=uncultured Draconibacterium sp. TaxID=1573823 RepID=UPI00321713E9
MRKLIFSILILFSFVTAAQERFTISGYVEDNMSGERLIGANVLVDKARGVASNQYGFYSLTLPAGRYGLSCRYIGYKPACKEINLSSDTVINISLSLGLELNEVQVTASKPGGNNAVSSLSHFTPGMEAINRMPAILGEQDLLKSIQFLPGIKGGAENTTGYSVRGGSADQNLILLDGVPVYNVNHLFGFLSVFNSDAIKNVSLYKGGIPARYGGRLSSVLDINMKEGNMQRQHGVLSVSPISARMTYEAPIVKDKAAYIVSFRRTMLDVPMVLYQKLIGLENTGGFKFYDLNAKANWLINPKNRIYLSVYSGRDKQFSKDNQDGISNEYYYKWGNLTSVLRLNHQLSQKLFFNTSVYYSHYDLTNLVESESEERYTKYNANSSLNDLSLTTDIDWYLSPNYTLRLGSKATLMHFAPNIVQTVDDEFETNRNQEDKNTAKNLEFYGENELIIDRFKANIGLRAVLYDTGKKNYISFEPRLAFKYNADNGLSGNVAFTQMSQFIHLLSNSSLGLPTDLWVGSTDVVAPQKGWQLSAGIEKHLIDYSFGVEAYYKEMKDVIRFEEGAVFLSSQNKNWIENINVGQGKAYGAEFMVKKEKGLLTGMLSYTLAWSERQFNEVNEGDWFPYKYDRRHDVSLVGEYQLFKSEWQEKTFSFGFTLQSGNNLSIPDVEYQGLPMPGMEDYLGGVPDWTGTRQTYDYPNNFRMPLFHHLDIGYNTKRVKSYGKTHTWSFSIYNVYNRMNPWYFYKDTHGKVKQVSIFPIVPSIGYKYTF